jgi:histidinol-phosphate phosphatase family protein
MTAAILAGGRGTRIGAAFPDLPKPMIPLCGKPILEHQIKTLCSCGIKDITLIVGYKSDVIKTYFGGGERFGVSIKYITEDEPLGTGGALSLLEKKDTLILLGDIYFDIDLKRFIDFHYEKKSGITLLSHPNNHPFDSDIIAADSECRVKAWKSKKDTNRGDLRNLTNAGMYIFGADFLPSEKTQKRDLEHDIIIPVLRTNSVFSYRTSEYIKDCGTPERLKRAENDMKSGTAAAKNLSRKQRAIFLDRDGTINCYDGLISSPEQIKLLPHAAEAIKLFNASPFLTICVTNQPVVARGMVTLDGLNDIHARLDSILGEKGAYLDDLLFCPHHPDKGYPEEVPEFKIECNCRKPKPGLLLEAAKRYNIDLSKSFMIGDSTSDIAAGQAAGCITGGVKTGIGLSDGKIDIKPDFMAENLLKAAERILGLKQ